LEGLEDDMVAAALELDAAYEAERRDG